ncbi:hypothetical protein B9Z19DRAFT_1191092 [Tuber borchii]|uniref:Uncharacterized protein n=1 Tax=Tuber borchii TaxID=42251 RepID=A0A2T7A161_TUBBO|nr:hypothetical protein B9Z19DRAFT_1191092 [Tuber borchii]
MGNSLWVLSSEIFLIEALFERVQRGDRLENGFKKAVWTEIMAGLNAAYVKTLEDKLFSVAQAKSKELSILGALGMRSWSPFMTVFYAIPSVHRQKDNPIRAFSMALQNSGGVRHAITKPFSDSVLHHPIYLQPKGHLHTTISHGATDQIPGALGMRSRSPFMTAFYPIPSVHRQKDIPIRAFSMALQSLLKGESICRIFLDVWKALTLKPDLGGVRHAIMKPFYDGVVRHPICPPPKGRLHTCISHGATEFSEGGVLMADFGGVRYVIMKPFYDGVLHHPICPPPKGHPHTSIFHGATESSERGIPGALGMRSQSPFTTAFYAIPSVHRQKDVSIRAFSMALQSPLKGDHYAGQILRALSMRSQGPFTTAFYAIPSVHRQKDVPIQEFPMVLQNSGGVRDAIMKSFYDGVLHHPICPPPKGHPHTSIFHGATESSEGGPDSGGVRHAITKPFYNGVVRHPICPPPKGRLHTCISHGATDHIPGVLGMRSWSPFMTVFYTIQAVHRQKGVSIEGVSIAQSP